MLYYSSQVSRKSKNGSGETRMLHTMRSAAALRKLLIQVVASATLASKPPLPAYYVAPNGSDATGNGSEALPWATPAFAAAQIRPLLPSQAGDVFVFLAGGTYTQLSPFVLGPADSGQNGFIVHYAGAPGSLQRPILDGALLVNPGSWRRVLNASTTGAEVWAAPLPPPLTTARQFWVGQDRANESVAVDVNLTASDTVMLPSGYLTTNAALLALVGASPPGLQFAADVELLYTSQAAQWQEARARVAAWAHVPSGGGASYNLSCPCLNVTMAQPGWALVTNKGYPEHLPSALTNFVTELQPGQGYASAALGIVYAPRPGEVLATTDVAVAALDAPLLALLGNRSAGSAVRNVAIEGIDFVHAAWLAPTLDGGYAPDQGGIIYAPSDLPPPLNNHATHPVPAAIRLSTAANVTVSGCSIQHVGGSALAVEDGSQDVTVSRNLVLDAGCSAFRLGQVDDIDETDPAHLNSRILVADNYAFGVAMEFRDCSGIFGGFITNSTIEHNTLLNTTWAGVTLGWMGWGKGVIRPSLGGNRINGNRIAYVNLIVGDGGPIYVMAPQPSRADCTSLDFSCYSEIANNFVSYAMHHAAMLYHDEGSAFFYTHDNAVLQPPFLRDPHGWWWSFMAAWATSEWNIFMARNTAVGINRTDIAQGPLNLTVVNSTLLPWGALWTPAAQAIVNASGVRPL